MSLFGIFGNNKPVEKSWFERYGGVPGITMIIILALVIVQIFGYLTGLVWTPAQSLKLGPMFILLAATAAVILPIVVLHLLWSETKMDRKDVVLIVIAGIMVVFVLLFFQKLVPSVFTQSIQQLQAIIPTG